MAPAWNVSAAEVEQLADCYALLLDKYFPGGVGQVGPELGAALVTLAVIGPRWSLPRRIEEKPAREGAQDAGHAATGGVINADMP